jgi:hypothetical protein
MQGNNTDANLLSLSFRILARYVKHLLKDGTIIDGTGSTIVMNAKSITAM